MKALTVTQYGVPAEMKLEERPEPKVGDGMALVRVRAAAVNPLDATVRAGWFPAARPAPLVLGNEGAGVVEAGTKFAPGTRVVIAGGFLGVGEDGTHQELMAVPESYLAPLPAGLSFVEGAAFPVAFLTAHLALTLAGEMKAGDWVAISGATGSVGHAALQVAKVLGGRTIAIVSNAEKAAQAELTGPAGVVDLSKEDLATGVARISEGHGADVAIDPVGGTVTGQVLHALAAHGRAVNLGYTAGVETTVNVLDLIAKPSKLVGFNLFVVPPQTVGESLGTLLGWAAEGKVRPIIDSTYPLHQAELAFDRLASRKAVGKVVLTL